MPTTDLDAKWPGSFDLFELPMTRGIENSVRMSYAYKNILDAKKTEGVTQMLMFTDYVPRHTALESITGIKGSDLVAQVGLTSIVVDNFDLIKEKLDHFEDEVIVAGFGRNSDEFKAVFGLNRNRFYKGSRTSKENAFHSLSLSMAPYAPMNAIATEIMTFHDTTLVATIATQQIKMTNVTTDQTGILSAQLKCAKGMDKGLGWAKILFADEPIDADRIRKINSCFPLALIQQQKQLEFLGLVNAGTHKQIVLRTFKAGDKVRIYVDGANDLLFMLMPDNHHACPPTAFKVLAGTTIEDLATVLGDLANRHVMVTNLTTGASHYEFTIIEA